jgi:hypothetical protein
MIQLDKDLAEAREILEGRSLLLPTVAHLRAMQIYHEDSIIGIANKLGLLHEAVMGIE